MVRKRCRRNKMRDIETRQDIEALLEGFYSVVMTDGEIGHHFNDLDLEHHLPIIANFWDKILFGNPVYFNNPLAVHQILHAKSPLLPEHFIRWVSVFSASVDKLFLGPVADQAKLKAAAIGDSLSQRLNGVVAVGNK